MGKISRHFIKNNRFYVDEKRFSERGVLFSWLKRRRFFVYNNGAKAYFILHYT